MLNPPLNNIELSLQEYKRYSRQILLSEIQVEGQKRLSQAKVLCIGIGALGSSLIAYLAAAGVGYITVIDYDIVDISNLQRQIIYNTSNINKAKVHSAFHYIQKLNPNCQITTLKTELNSVNIRSIIYEHDVILDGTDNLSTRHLINKMCILFSKPWVYGAVFQFEGQVSVFNYQGGPQYHDIYPLSLLNESAIPSCTEGGIIGVIPGIIGVTQATEALKIILGIGTTLSGKILKINLLNSQFKELKIRHNIKLDISTITQEKENNILESDSNIIKIENLKDFLTSEKTLLIDVRSSKEFLIDKIPGAINYPLNQLKDKKILASLKESKKQKIIYCSLNSRSKLAFEILQANNINALKLHNGLRAWKINAHKFS